MAKVGSEVPEKFNDALAYKHSDYVKTEMVIMLYDYLYEITGTPVLTQREKATARDMAATFAQKLVRYGMLKD